MKKQMDILNYIRTACMNGSKLTGREVSKQFKTNNMQLALVESLGYIKPIGSNKYKWSVGDVMPVMAKRLKEETTKYYKKFRKKSVSITPEEGPSEVVDIRDNKDTSDQCLFLKSKIDELEKENKHYVSLINKLSEPKKTSITAKIKTIRLFGIKIYEKNESVG